MKEIIYFDAEAHDDGLSGIVMPYGQQADRLGYKLVVEPGAFAGRMADVIVNEGHDQSRLLGRTGPKGNVDLTDSRSQLMLSMTYPNTQIGRDAKILVDTGVLRGFSAELSIMKDSWNGGVRRVLEASLSGIGLVARPAMKDAVLFSDNGKVMVLESGLIEFKAEMLQRRNFRGELRWDEITVESMARRRAVMFLKDSLDIDMPVTLMLGADYNASAANTHGDGSLTLRKTNTGIEWRVKRLPKTENGDKILQLLAGGLITGWRAGFVPRQASTRQIEHMGFDFTLQEVVSAQLCEVRLTSDGTGGNGNVQGVRRRRRG